MLTGKNKAIFSKSRQFIVVKIFPSEVCKKSLILYFGRANVITIPIDHLDIMEINTFLFDFSQSCVIPYLSPNC